MATNLKKWGVFGAIVGALTPPVIKFLSGLNIPGVSVTQATISVDVNAPNTGLAQWLLDFVGVNLPSIPFQSYVMAAVGGALFIMLGAVILDMMKALGGKKYWKVTKVLAVASVATTLILGGFSMSAFTFTSLGAIFVSSLALGLGYAFIDDNTSMKLIP